jgi:hypothetical protein
MYISIRTISSNLYEGLKVKGITAKLAIVIATMVLLSSAFFTVSSISRAAEAGWQTFVIDTNGGHDSSMANDSWGHLHIAFYDQTNGDLKYANNTAGTWVTQTVESTGDTGLGCSIAIDQQGCAHISYFNSSSFNLNYATNVGGSWSIVTVDGSGHVGPATSIALDSQGHVHISYWANTDLGSHLGYVTNKPGAWTNETVDPSSGHGSYSSIAIDSFDNVHISYYGSGALHYANNIGVGWNIRTIDSASPNAIGTYSSLKIDADDKVHIAYTYRDGSSPHSTLKYANNTSGSWINSTVATSASNDVGNYSSMALDSQGRAHISFIYNIEGVEYSTNVGGTWDTTRVDDEGRYQTSIVIDQEGYAHISYLASGSNTQMYSTNAPVADIQDPTVSITGPTSSPTYSTSVGTLALSGTATDNVAVTSVTWSNPATGASGTAIGLASWSISSLTLASGDNPITVKAFDAAGNNGTDTITVTYTPDTTDPTIQIDSPVDTGYYATSQNHVVISGTASDNAGVTTVTWANAATGESGTTAGTSLWSVNVPLEPGNNSITLTAHDAAGNAGDAVIAVNYTAPTDIVNPTASVTSPTSGPTYTSSSATISLSGTASDNVGVTSVTWFNLGTGASGTATGTTSWSISDILLSSGENVITVTAHDAGGNTGNHVLTVTYNPPDVTDPSIAITTPSGATFSTNSSSLTVSGSSSDDVGVVNVSWSNNRGGSGMATVEGGSWSISSIPLHEGSNVITVTAKDAANNSATATITVTFTGGTADDGLSTEVIIAIVGVIVVAVLFIFFFVWRRRKKKA